MTGREAAGAFVTSYCGRYGIEIRGDDSRCTLDYWIAREMDGEIRYDLRAEATTTEDREWLANALTEKAAITIRETLNAAFDWDLPIEGS